MINNHSLSPLTHKVHICIHQIISQPEYVQIVDVMEFELCFKLCVCFQLSVTSTHENYKESFRCGIFFPVHIELHNCVCPKILGEQGGG